ncbi:histidine ammonia-lyase [candidate division KSB1 bacterium]|nr:histidine ammonia-lyase [candidate division KSB1 bacterium]RQW10165.1 MAG: histidine ammonia-lyase [candidate division KSB1 bacterium]
MNQVIIDGESLTLQDVARVAHQGYRISIDPLAIERMQRSRKSIEKIVAAGRRVYGVNTGFGKLSNVHISSDELQELQLNLVLSHACGTGDLVPVPIVRAALLLKANTLCKGYSGARPDIAQFLVKMLNRRVLPNIPAKGSVGASGDLAPLAHMTLVMLGLGEATLDGVVLSGEEALQIAQLEPIRLRAKEGLALLNGTQIMTAYAVEALLRAHNLVKLADIAGAITVESLLGTATAFDERIQIARGFPDQIQVARNMRSLMADSEITASHANCDKVQDPYSSRCIPQVHGAVRQAIRYATDVIKIEMNAATDNPLIFWEDGDVLSGGNFHGQPVASACDTLAIAVAQLANISERRLENLMDASQSGLPPFLAPESGVNSGYMIAQVTAAALVSENKVLCHPASVDSIPTSANQEDFVSMGAFAARKALDVVENAETVIGIELLAGCQAIEFRRNLRPGRGSGIAYETVRQRIPTMQHDRLLKTDIDAMKGLVKINIIVNSVEAAVGTL